MDYYRYCLQVRKGRGLAENKHFKHIQWLNSPSIGRLWGEMLVQPECTQAWLDDIEPTSERDDVKSCEERMYEKLSVMMERQVGSKFIEWLDSGSSANPRVFKESINPWDYCLTVDGIIPRPTNAK